MSWSVEGRTVVELPKTFTVQGEKTLGGVTVQCNIDLQIYGWPPPDDTPPRPLALVLRPALCRFRSKAGEVSAPLAHPVALQLIQIPLHPANLLVRYDLFLPNTSLTELEEIRNAGAIRLDLCLGAIALIAPLYSDNNTLLILGPNQTQSAWIGADIPQESWLAVLLAAGFAETLLFEVPLAKTERVDIEKARSLLGRAMKRRLEGPPTDVLADTRKVVDALKQAGFGGKAPEEVADFLQHKARSLSMEERFVVLQIALKIFTSPAHHVHVDGDDFTRADADMALALAAALVKLAPIRSRSIKDAGSDGNEVEGND